jgi:phosphoglucosamine mutase
MDRVPQVLVNEKFARRAPIDTLTTTRAAIERIEASLGDAGRVLVRWSGTEPKLRVMIEGEDETKIRALAEEILVAARADLA